MSSPSLLDTDLYKLTMMQVVFARFPRAEALFRFKCRTLGADLGRIRGALQEAVDGLSALSLSPEERAYLAETGLFSSSFLDTLAAFRFDPRCVRMTAGDGGLQMEVEGLWLATILFEIPLLAMVNSLWFAHTVPGLDLTEGRRRLEEKVALVNHHATGGDFRFSDFGTRRRFSLAWQREVVERLAVALPGRFVGTSNVRMAMDLGLAPVGTMAHEYLQAAQSLAPTLAESQRFALATWLEVYGDKLGIALTDVCGLDAFLRDFGPELARRYQGVRHDSGDPVAWGERMIAHYQGLGLDPREKKLVFSDGLDMPLALALHDRFRGRSQPFFGIGTNLTNDVGPKALQVVIKMVRLNGKPVAKISDSPGKQMCDDPLFLAELAKAFAIDSGRVGQ